VVRKSLFLSQRKVVVLELLDRDMKVPEEEAETTRTDWSGN
jgi:hypothetical protein